MKRSLIAIAAVAVLSAGIALAQTAEPPAKPAQPALNLRAALRRRIVRKLNLTDAQKAQAKAIMQQAKTSAQPIRQQLRQNRQALSAAVESNNAAEIQSLSTAQGALRGQVLAIRSAAKAKFYAILTPDQQTAATGMQDKVKQLFQ